MIRWASLIKASLSASDCEIFEEIAAGIHDGHNGPGQIFTQDQSADHRHHRDGINSKPPCNQSRVIDSARPTTIGIVPAVQIALERLSYPNSQLKHPKAKPTSAIALIALRASRSLDSVIFTLLSTLDVGGEPKT